MSQLFNILAHVLVACFFLVERSSGKYRNHHKSSLNKERPASFLLGPPLTEEEIVLTLKPVLETRDESHFDEFIQSINFFSAVVYMVTNGLKTLEAEADGHPLKDIWLIPGYYLMSLHEVVETLSIMMRTSGVWIPSWLPLFASRTGDFVVFDTENGHIHEILTKESEMGTKQLRDGRDGRILLNENGLYDVIITDSQKHEVYEDTILDAPYVSPNARNIFNIEIVVHEENIDIPNLDFDCTNMPRVCRNIRNAIAKGKTRRLQRITDSKQILKNRRAACGKVTCKGINNSCDEYPFASTSQGGAGATTMCVPLSENNSQGGQLNRFYSKNNVKNKDWFKVRRP
ncbi:hypothetical protein ACJMK2_021776 [Sinanodonta woodiana]|uniref:Deoxyribonuclease NucA/NucB domain-containing protein n=1 Tax=Sinanodonta woodiana TaxID=1069815 RepID=A0ABD3TJJ2_SINWO